MLNNKNFCEEVGIKPLIKCVKCGGGGHHVTINTCKWCGHSGYNLQIFPDFLSKTPEAAFNRELLEECILKVKPTYCIDLYEDKDKQLWQITTTAASGDESYYVKTSRPEALLSLATAIKDEIKEEISKVTEFIY